MNERMKILIAYDGSKCAGEALDDLPRAGLPRDADVLIVQVKERWEKSPARRRTAETAVAATSSFAAKPARKSEASPAAAATAVAERPASLERALEETAAYFPEWKTKTLLLEGSPARKIVRAAAEWNADLIVVGSHGCTESKRFVLGSVSHKIANEACCSVRVVRGQTWKNGSPSRHVIGLDGSPAAMAAVAEVAARMWTMGSEVRLIVARDETERDYKSACEFLDAARKVLERAELVVTELIEDGDPKKIIVSSAEEWGADCIFLGANDAPKVERNHLLGSISTAVVARAHCMVEIVRKKQATPKNV